MGILVSNATSRLLLCLALSIFSTGTTWADIFTGPVSKYYLDGYNTIYVVQGTNVVESFPTVYGQGVSEGVLAVSDTIRTRARSMPPNDLKAGEYTLAGIPTGYSYFTPLESGLAGNSVYDGTSDGTNNYYVLHSSGGFPFGGVYRTDYYWQNPGWLFSPGPFLTGIAYDPTNDSLWISSPGPSIQDYSMDGTLLAEFDGIVPGIEYFGKNTALGLDPADHTIWVATEGNSMLRQYSLDGATFGDLLQIGTPDGLPPFGFDGGDFQEPVPEPAAFLLLLTVIGVIGYRIRCLERSQPISIYAERARKGNILRSSASILMLVEY